MPPAVLLKFREYWKEKMGNDPKIVAWISESASIWEISSTRMIAFMEMV
jgi:hypothetical protein